MALPLKYFHWF